MGQMRKEKGFNKILLLIYIYKLLSLVCPGKKLGVGFFPMCSFLGVVERGCN
jgi:hypothetical protein